MNVIDFTDKDLYDFYVNGRKIESLDRVVRAHPEDGWILVYVEGPTTRRILGQIEAVHRKTGIVRRTAW